MEAESPEEGTLGKHLRESAVAFEQARKKLHTLPEGSIQATFPPNFTEAQSLVTVREDERRKASAKRDKYKQRSLKSKETPAAEPDLPGTIPGAEPKNTAFWISTEGYFRDVTATDVRLLCPAFDEPLRDPIFGMPAPGPPYAPEKATKAKESSKPAPTPEIKQEPKQELKSEQKADLKPEARSRTKPMSPVHSGGATANGTPSVDTEKQRKSSRLHNKAVSRESQWKKAEAVSPQQAAATPNPPAPKPEVPPPAAPELQIVPPGIASSGQIAEYLLQTVKEQDVALLTSKVMAFTGSEAAEVAAACRVDLEQFERWTAAGARESSRETRLGEAGLPAESQIHVHDWLAVKVKELTQGQGGEVAEKNLPKATACLSGLPGSSDAEKLPDSWSQWLQSLKKERSDPRQRANEAVHPYIEMMLGRPTSAYTAHHKSVGLSRDGGAATSNSAMTPSASGDHSRGTHEAVADTASAVPGRLAAVGSPFTPPPVPNRWPLGSTHPRSQTPAAAPKGTGLASLVTPATPVNGPFAPTPVHQLAERLQSHAEAGPSSQTDNGLGSHKRSIPNKKHKGQPLGSSLLGKPSKSARTGFQIDPNRNALTAAIAAFIAAGPEEGRLNDQWQQLADSAELLALAPDDELSAEILALQGELLQQMAINRERSVELLGAVLQDMPRQQEAAAQRKQGVEIARAWFLMQRAAKRTVKREKREAAQREAQQAAEAILQISPRKVPGRVRGSGADTTAPDSRGFTPPPEALMYDLLAERGAEDDALCSHCGGGDSDKTDANEIVFCERCDVAVHQKCYGVDVIPSGEWLCWPCKRFEEAELESGKPQSQIRPPRWEQGVSKQGSPNKDLAGGGRSVQCLLCPVRRGAFRQTVDCKHWVHQVCALWHPETSIWQNSACAAIDGVADIKPERWNVECDVCRRSEGAVIRCNAGHCATPFHPLCARNNGQHLAMRDAGPGSAPMPRAYCSLHSEAQREKDFGQALTSEGPASFMRKEAKIRQHLHRATQAAAEVYERHHEERKILTRIRLELESLRILVQRINKRERLKREELRASFELHQGRLENPEWTPTGPVMLEAHFEEAADGSGKVRRGAVRPRIETSRPTNMQVDREVMMTTGEAAATNDRLPKGFMYVPFDALKGSDEGSSPPE